ncbi:MAG TPA: heavy metal transporter, partial [Candidatus Pacearchaeota archaeon]|nr:heavy metal transporter [Candidatus Pacearchaeota archaeon]
CNSCAQLIENNLRDLVNSISVSYSEGKAEIDFNPDKISEDAIRKRIKELGYGVGEEEKKKSNKLGWIVLIISFFILIYVLYDLFGGINFTLPNLGEKTSLFLLFFAGLLTGFHCVAMCGGFLVSYTTKNALNGHKSFYQHLVYGAGKTISYTIMGILFGLIGSIFFFTPLLRGGIAIFAGIFMIFYSLSMFGFGFFKRFQFNPKFLTKIASKKYKGAYFGPAMTGLLNGLFLACGPLQALYIYAAGTGSAISGGASLMAFGLGTLPVMLGFGGIANVISHKATKKILKISAVIVLALGLIMLNRGLALTGSGYDMNSMISKAKGVSGVDAKVFIDSEGYQVINMEVNRYGWSPDSFVLKKDVPVKWVIDGKEITGCNNEIQVPKLGLKFDIKKGEQVIEFTPTKEGLISWSCWMGMIPGTFIVTDTGVASQEQINSAEQQATASGGSCDGSCGSPSCGGGTSRGCGCGG